MVNLRWRDEHYNSAVLLMQFDIRHHALWKVRSKHSGSAARWPAGWVLSLGYSLYPLARFLPITAAVSLMFTKCNPRAPFRCGVFHSLLYSGLTILYAPLQFLFATIPSHYVLRAVCLRWARLRNLRACPCPSPTPQPSYYTRTMQVASSLHHF